MKLSLFSKTSKVFKDQLIQNKTLTYPHFNFFVLLIALFPVFSIGLFNVAIDPYNVLNSPTFSGINVLKPEQDKQNKLFKAVEVMRFKPKIILLGSSRIVLGLNPEHPSLLNGNNTYNLGIPGVHVYELRRYLEHVIVNQPNLKQVVIGIDFFMFNDFNKNSFQVQENLLEKTAIPLQDLLNIVFSLEGFEASKTTIALNRKASDLTPYYLNGMRDNKKTDESNDNKETMKSIFLKGIKRYLNDSNYYKNYSLNVSLTEFKKVIDICRDRNIDVKVFISPEHTTQMEAIRVAGLWSVFEEWKRQVSTITPVWDFAEYNKITTESINNEMQYFLDSTHYRKEVGDKILNRVLSYQQEPESDDFGVLITPENIESHLAKIRANREVWTRSNPDVVKLVQQIKHKSEEKRK